MSPLRPALRTGVSFQASGFNQTEPREYFINPCCFGDDLARWLIAELGNRGIEAVPEPGQEDFGWYLTFRHEGTSYNLVLGLREVEDGPGDWFACLESSRRVNLFFSRKNPVAPATLDLVHQILTASDQVSNVRWHFLNDWMAGREEGALAPHLP